jgi:hypothetical protein
MFSGESSSIKAGTSQTLNIIQDAFQTGLRSTRTLSSVTVSVSLQNLLVGTETLILFQKNIQTGAYPGFFFGGGFYTINFFRGVQQIQLRIESRENGDLGAVAP